MDDLKRQLKEIAKYSFWIISGLVLLLSSIIFYLTSTSMYSSISQRINTVNGVFSKINEVGGRLLLTQMSFPTKRWKSG